MQNNVKLRAPRKGSVNISSQMLFSKSSPEPTPVYKIKVSPKSQSHVMLGELGNDAHLKGVLVELTPNPDPSNSVVTQVTRRDSQQTDKLFMHIANHGNKTVTALVRRLP